MFVQEVWSQLSRDRYSLEELQKKPRPPGVDLLRLESYLTDQEFQVFHILSNIPNLKDFLSFFIRIPVNSKCFYPLKNCIKSFLIVMGKFVEILFEQVETNAYCSYAF